MGYYQNHYFSGLKKRVNLHFFFLFKAKWRSTTWFTTFWDLHIFVTFARLATWENEGRKVNFQIFTIPNMHGLWFGFVISAKKCFSFCAWLMLTPYLCKLRPKMAVFRAFTHVFQHYYIENQQKRTKWVRS